MIENDNVTSFLKMLSHSTVTSNILPTMMPETDSVTSTQSITYQGNILDKKPIYLFVWIFLVILTSLVNVVVIFVLTRKNMRNVTNMILVSIAISDSLTGLVTLPSYIAVYQRSELTRQSQNNTDHRNLFESHLYDNWLNINVSDVLYGTPLFENNRYIDVYQRSELTNRSQNNNNHSYWYESHLYDNGPHVNVTGVLYDTPSFETTIIDYYDSNGPDYGDKTVTTETYNYYGYYDYNFDYVFGDLFYGIEAPEGLKITEDLCHFFMISKFYVSMVFHTVSIWLTLFLGVQRYISVALPFKVKYLFNTKTTLKAIGVIVLLAPVLHIYHLVDNKVTKDKFCKWDIQGCKDGACVHLWFTIIFMHYIPCLLLVAFTCLFIKELRRGASTVSQMGSVSNSASQRRRTKSNRRISIIVTTLVVVFLIPEIPYAGFLTYSTIGTHLNKDISYFESNRAFRVAYEVLLVLSFHANFYIYTLLNKRFRHGLKEIFVYPIRKLIGKYQSSSVTGKICSAVNPRVKLHKANVHHERATELQTMNST